MIKRIFTICLSLCVLIPAIPTGLVSVGVAAGNIASAPIVAPEAPEDVTGATYYLSETFSALPSGTKTPASGVAYTLSSSGNNSFNNDYNAIQHVAYAKGVFASPITTAGEYVMSVDFMAPTPALGNGDVRIQLDGSLRLVQVLADGKLYIGGNKIADSVEADHWYRLTANIALPGGDVVATVTDLTNNNEVVGTKNLTGLTAITQFNINFTKVTTNPFYTQNWRLYTTTQQSGEDGGGEDDEGNGESSPTTTAPSTPVAVEGATYFLNERFSTLPTNGSAGGSLAPYTWTTSSSSNYSNDYDALDAKSGVKVLFGTPISSAGDYVFSLDFMLPNTTLNTNLKLYLFDSFKMMQISSGGGALYLCQADSKVSLTANTWYRLKATVTLPSGDVSATLINPETNEELVTKSATGKTSNIKQIFWAPDATLTSSVYTQNWQLYTTTPQSGGDDEGGDNDGGETSQPTAAPSAPEDVEGATYFVKETFGSLPANGSSGTTGTTSYIWQSNSNSSYDSTYNAIAQKAVVKADFDDITKAGDYVMSVDFMAPTPALGNGDVRIQLNGSLRVVQILSNGDLYLGGNKIGALTANHWYRATANITLPSGNVTATVIDLTDDSALVGTKELTGLTTITQFLFNFTKVTTNPLYTQNWRLYTTTPQSGGDDDGDDDDDVIVPDTAPQAPSDVINATYYLKETFSAVPSGTRPSVNGTMHSFASNSSNSFSSEINAVAQKAYAEALFSPAINLEGDYVFTMDFMASSTSLGAPFRVYLDDATSWKLMQINDGTGNVDLCQQETGKPLTLGKWYRLTTNISLPSGNVTATVTDIKTGDILASKSADGKLTSIAKVRIAPTAVTSEPLYTQHWRLYTTTDQSGSDIPSLEGKDFASGKTLQYYALMAEDISYTNKKGETLATDGKDDTCFDTGRITNHVGTSGAQIAPFIKLDAGVRYNKIRVKHSVEASQNAPHAVLLRCANNGAVSSQYQTIATYTGKTDVDAVARFPVRTEQYVGYHFNAGTDDIGKWQTSFKLYSLEVYYDGEQMEKFSLPETATASETETVRVKVNAKNADGEIMTDFSDYTWKVEKIFGCSGVEFDEETGELILPTNTESGEIKVTVSHIEDPTLSFTDTMLIFSSDENMENIFYEIYGQDKIIIPAVGENRALYRVNDVTGKETSYTSILKWSLAESYPGVTLNNSEIFVNSEATVGTIIIKADADGHVLTKQISICPPSASVSAYPAEVTGPMFVVSPYYGEQEENTAHYKAIDFNGNEVTDVSWKLKGAPDGVTISENGQLSVKCNVTATEIKVIALVGDVAAEKRINIVERYDGAPNLLRLSGTDISIQGGSNTSQAYDGDFTTASNNPIYNGTRVINVNLPKNYDIDVFRVYKDFGEVYDSAQVYCRIGSLPFGGKSWCNAPLASEVWNPGPAYNSNKLQYGMNPIYHGIDVYEIELYSSYMRFSSIEAPSDCIAIPSGGSNTMQLRALGENEQELATVIYDNGEIHPLKWGILTPAEGVSICEDTGLISVESNARPTVITVEAIYFGRALTKSIKIGSGNAAQMDYDWLTFDKLSKQSQDNVDYKMTLPYEGVCGSTISWSSSNPAYLTEYGDVYIPYANGDKEVTLTATITGGGTTLIKEFNVTIKQPKAFEDLNSLSDRELFGLWDAENNEWAMNGKFNYDINSDFASVGEAVREMDYSKAKELLYEITLDKLRDPTYTTSISPKYGESQISAYSNYVTSYGLKMLEPITIGNERKWYSHDIINVLSTHPRFNLIFQSEMKDYTEVEIDSKESEYAPYIIVKFSNGTEKRFDVLRDTTLRAGYYNNVNYGAESVLKIKDDTGYPIDANTKRAYMYFDLTEVELSNVSSAELFIHGQNVSKTGNKSLYVAYNVSEWDEMEETWTSAKVSDSFYSYSGPHNSGFSYSFSPGGDAEVTYQQNGGRLYYMWQAAAGFPTTRNEKYSYEAFRMIDNYFRKAGECTSYPRGLDSVTRNQNILSVYKNLVNSDYMTPETAVTLWKHIWRQQDDMLIGRDPFWHSGTANIEISLSEHILKTSIEFPEFADVDKWIDFYLSVMQPILESYILEDGSYVESADGYATSSITKFANSVLEATKAGIELGSAYFDKIHASLYNYVAMKAPKYANISFGDSWSGGGSSTVDDFVIKMAKFFDDDELLYIGAYGDQGGTEPNNASLYFPETRRAYMRSEWSKDASYLMINDDDGFGGHAHGDDLSIIAYAYGDFVIPDTSVLSYATDDVSLSMRKSEQHNTLGRITNVDTGEISQQSTNRELEKTKVVNWQSDNAFDYYSANAKSNLFTGKNNLDYNRKVLFVKPGYWIVSDYVNDNSPLGSKNKYEIMFHFMPNSNPRINGTGVATKSNSSNVTLVTPDENATLSIEDAYYTTSIGNYTMTDRAVFAKTADSEETVTFDTIVFPSKPSDKNVSVSSERISMDVGTDIASAMHIIRSDNNGEFDDYYYYTNEKNFDENATFTERAFGEFTFDGELSYQSYSKDGKLKSALMISGTHLLKNGEDIIKTDVAADMFDITIDNSIMYINCSEEIEKLGNIIINPMDTVNGVFYNNVPAEYTISSDGKIVMGSEQIMFGNEVITEENGDAYISLLRVNTGGKFSYDGKSYEVNITIPDKTKIKPIDNWDGMAVISVISDETGANAGTVTIKTADNRNIEFLTPYTIYVEQHASASVSSLNGSATTKTNRDKLWITTNSSSVTVGKIKQVSLPGGFDTPGGNTGGDNSGGGGAGGGAGGAGGGATGGGDTTGDITDDTPKDEQPDTNLPISEIFNDVGGVEWAHEAIVSLYQRKIVNGVGEGLFAPNNMVTRAEFVTMIVRAFNLVSDETNVDFSDVSDGMWYTDAINIAAGIGIVKGTSENVFDINAPITRQDMMVILYRIKEHLGIKGEKEKSAVISDYDEISDYAKDAVDFMVSKGIVNGVGENRVAPKDFATRAQSAKIIYGVLSLYDNN